MSLEAAIAANTQALTSAMPIWERVAALLEQSNEGRAAALAAAQNLAQAEPKTTRTRKAAETKTDTAPASETPAAPATVTETPAAAPVVQEAPKVPTIEEVRQIFGNYMTVDDPTEREKRKSFVVSLLAEIGVAKAGEIPEDQRARAIDLVKRKQAGEDVNFSADPEDDLLG